MARYQAMLLHRWLRHAPSPRLEEKSPWIAFLWSGLLSYYGSYLYPSLFALPLNYFIAPFVLLIYQRQGLPALASGVLLASCWMELLSPFRLSGSYLLAYGISSLVCSRLYGLLVADRASTPWLLSSFLALSTTVISHLFWSMQAGRLLTTPLTEELMLLSLEVGLSWIYLLGLPRAMRRLATFCLA